MDDSAVVEIVDWGFLFESDEYSILTKTEETACRYQREYRINKGFNPITGEVEKP